MKKYKRLGSLLFPLAALLFSQPSGWAFTEGRYDQKVSVEGTEIATIKVAFKDDKMKAESNFGGMTAWMVRNENGTFSYLPAQNVATKIPASMDRPNLTHDLPRFMKFLEENSGKKIGSEEIDGKKTDIYSFTEPSLQKEAKAWVLPQEQFPVKIEVDAPEGKTVIELTNIDFSKIDEATFKLPEGVKIVDLGAPPSAPPAPPMPEPQAEALPAAEEKETDSKAS